MKTYETPRLPAGPDRLPLPAPEHYITPGAKAPDVIHAQPLDGKVQGIQWTKPSTRDRIYAIRAELAKQQPIVPQRTRSKKPRAKVR